MRSTLSAFEQQERQLLAEKKPLLPTHAGESRYQRALDNDRNYREMILAAFALSVFTISGFGQASSSSGPLSNALMCLALGGFAVRAIAYRFTKSKSGESLVEGSTPRLICVVLLGFGILGSIMGGMQGLTTILVVAGSTAIILLATQKPLLWKPMQFVMEPLFVTSLGWIFGSRSDHASLALGFAGALIGILIAVTSFLSNWDQPTAVHPTLLITSLASYAWVLITVTQLGPSSWLVIAAIVACIVVALLERLVSVRASFAPIVVLLILVHLASFLDPLTRHNRPLSPQLMVLILEFGLIGMAGYRHALASLARYPVATYRSSPQCLVPTLDHAWEHPVKIDAT